MTMYAQQYGGGGAESQASYDSALLFLKQLNTKELQDLMEDTERLNKMVDDLDIVKNQELEKETQLASNKSLAEYNLSREPMLIELRQQLAETYEQAAAHKAEFERSRQGLSSVAPTQSLDTTLALLQTEAAKSEEDSETCADSYLSGQIDSDAFIRRYIELRTQAHVRKVKVEKLSEIVREQEQVRNHMVAAATRPIPQPPFIGYTPPSAAPGPMWGAAPPYPMNPMPAGFPQLNNTAVYHA